MEKAPIEESQSGRSPTSQPATQPFQRVSKKGQASPNATRQAKEDKKQAPIKKPVNIIGFNPSRPMYRGRFWDIQLEVGYLWWDKEKAYTPAWGRLRGGILLVSEPYWLGLGLIVDGGGIDDTKFGIQGELTHLWSGFWVQSTLGFSHYGRFSVGGSLGWSIFGVEYQYHPQIDGAGHALLTKLRLPIGIFIHGRNI